MQLLSNIRNLFRSLHISSKAIFGYAGIVLVLGASVPLIQHFQNKNAQTISPQAVLGAQTAPFNLEGNIVFNIPAAFNQGLTSKGLTVNGDTTLNGSLTISGKSLNLGGGTITASNVLYSLTAGNGVTIGTGQNPTVTNTGVTSLQGSTGSLALVAGTGISISGLTISNTANSGQNIFQTVTNGTTSFSAGSTTDTLTLAAGTGIGVAVDATNKTITISNSGNTNVNLSGTVTGVLGVANGGTGATTFASNGVLYGNGTSAIQATGQGTNGQVLTANGIGVPTWSNLSISTSSCTNCIASNPAMLQIIQPTSDVTGLTVEQSGVATPTADIFNVTNNAGTIKYLQVDSSGNVIINNTDLQLGGTMSMKTDNTNLANINDTFVYSTANDTDAGAWTNNGNAQASSWYNETINDTGTNCVLGTDTRCGTREFPKKATFLATNTHLYIYDDSNNTLWMTFNLGTGFAFSGSPTLSPVYALNGVAYVGTSTNGLVAIDFINDRILQYNYNAGSGGVATFLGTVAARNSNKGYGAVSTWGQIASDTVNGVFVRVINGKTYAAVSTLGGVSVINITDQKVNRYIDN